MFLEGGEEDSLGEGHRENVFLFLVCFGLLPYTLAWDKALVRDNSTADGEGSPAWIGKCCQPDSHPSTLSQPPSRPSALSVCREDCSDLVLDSTVVRGGADIPDTPTGPSLENPPENLFPVVVSVASRSGGARGRASGRCSLRAARGVGLRRSWLCSLGPRPAGARTPDFGGHAVAPGAPTASLRRSRAGRKGGSRRPAQRSFLELPVQRSEKPPGSPRLWEATPQSSSEAMGVLCHPRSWPFGHHWENDRNTQAPTESGHRLPDSLPQLFILSSLRGGEFGERPEA